MAAASMRIGLDFDNTIVCYDAAIAVLTEELLDLPPKLPRTKLGLRDYLRASGREQEWTAFQGALYGPGMAHAQPFEGAIETMQGLVNQGHLLTIVSHRSRRPYAGPPHDLHAAARGWVAEHLQPLGLFANDEGVQGSSSAVNFLETRDAKLATIAQLGCQVFVDDLPEVLQASGFPSTTAGILFSPTIECSRQGNHRCISAWVQLPELVAKLL